MKEVSCSDSSQHCNILFRSNLCSSLTPRSSGSGSGSENSSRWRSPPIVRRKDPSRKRERLNQRVNCAKKLAISGLTLLRDVPILLPTPLRAANLEDPSFSSLQCCPARTSHK